MANETAPLLLLDGMSLAFRAYYALPPDLSTEDGTVTNALHGFVSMLSSLIRDQKPRALVVAFDLPGGTFRDAIADDYKGGRGETPEDLPPQFDMIREVLASLAIPVISREGFEADDVIATLASRSRDEKMPVIVVTGDRDTYQLVEDPYIRVLYNKRGVSDYALYDEAGILERTGVHPRDYPFYAALRGDPSDNLPGVHGVGEKIAAKLVNEFRDFDNLLANADAFTPKLKENILAGVDRVRVNLQVMPLVRDVELEADPAEFHLGGWDPAVAETTFARFELNSLWKRISGLMAKGLLGSPSGESLDVSKLPVPGVAQEAQASAPQAKVKVKAAPVVKRSVLKDDPAKLKAALGSLNEALVAVSRADDPQLGLLAAGQSEGFVTELQKGLELLSSAKKVKLSGLNLKPLLKMLVDAGFEHPHASFDAALAAYLIDPDRGNYDCETVAEIAGITLQVGEVEVGTVPGALAGELDLVAAAAAPLRAQLEALGMASLFDEIEMPLVLVLARMESRGIRVNREALAALAESLTSQVAELEQMVYEFAGKEFNLNSPAQLRELLFVDLGLTPVRKTKTGFSTDAKTLESLREEHPIIPAMLEYREYEKLRSTYGSSLLEQVGDDERIHATFRQTVARTGRLSSEAPNLHNIPVRSRLGAQFRELFIPEEGWELLAADYDQIELRVIAHLSGDPGLISAFNSAEDVHRQVASQVFGVPAAKVSKAQREKAKVVSYGLAYGMEAFGLSQRMQTSPEEAKDIVNGYFAAYPGVKAYMDAVVDEAKIAGFTRTEFGRIRPLPELQNANFRVRTAAERQAMNSGIQGLAADIFKAALVRLDYELESQGLNARIVLQVHDEILVEAPAEERAAVEAATIKAMQGAAQLRVDLEISWAWGSSWGAAKAG